MIMVPMFANVCQLSCVMNNQTEMKNPVQKQTELCFPFFFLCLGSGIMELWKLMEVKFIQDIYFI